MTMPERPNGLPPISRSIDGQSLTDFRFIMIEPSHPGNVGAAARAIKTMGFTQLVLVHPKPQIITHPDAIAMASGALDVLDATQVVDTLAQALAPVHLSFALSARSRYLGPQPCTIRHAAVKAVEKQQQGGQIAFVFGTERIGLTNEQTAQCNYLCHIPANPAYSSLNVAQALQLTAWELRYALLKTVTLEQNTTQTLTDQDLLPKAPQGKKHQRARPATNAQVDALLAHWHAALLALDFISADDQKRIPERMAHFFHRAQMREDEVSLFRGICSAILKTKRNHD